MRYWIRKSLQYGGTILFALILYGAITLLWSLLAPWNNYQWNNSAIQTNGTITDHEIREFKTQDKNLYAGFISVTYDTHWAQLCAVEDTTSHLFVEQMLNERFPISGNVTIYYQQSAPSDPHLGPKSILPFIVWCSFNVVLFMGLMTTTIVIIYRDHRKNYHPAEHIKLYTKENIPAAISTTTAESNYIDDETPRYEIDLNNYSPEYDVALGTYTPHHRPEDNVKFNNFLPASYNL